MREGALSWPRVRRATGGAKPSTPAARFWRVFRRNRFAAVSLWVLAATSVLGPLVVRVLVGAAVAVTATAIGLVLGTLAGYRGGWIDHVIMRVADALLIIPTFFLVLSIAFVFGGTLTSVIVLLGVTLWPPIARIVRAEV